MGLAQPETLLSKYPKDVSKHRKGIAREGNIFPELHINDRAYVIDLMAEFERRVAEGVARSTV